MSVKQTHVKQNTGTMQTAAEISARAHEILHRYWGYDSFRPCQLDIITSVMQGHDTLGLMPTGGGKSLTFQVPAMILEGLTVVVTPLISLMKDQVDALKDRDIRAGALYSGQTPREARLVYDRARLGILRLLYVSPERLGTETFRQHLQAFDIRLIVVDEAHCISQWGYDFRPSYLKIAELRTLVPDVPILALTASATPQVRRDIMARLNFGSDAAEYTLSFARPNISFVVRHIEDKDAKLFDVLDHTSGTAIVYVRSRRRTGQIAQMLCERGISAAAYHAGMDADEKARRQELWKSSKIRVIVATNAFGMGIDKADVRTVIHYDLPSSLEEYYQEAGRAGRDGLPSFAVIIAKDTDKGTLTRRLSEAFPPREYILRVYELAGNFLDIPVGGGYDRVYPFDFDKFCATYSLQPGVTRSALSILTLAGAIEYHDPDFAKARAMMTITRDSLYGMDMSDNAERTLTAFLRNYTGSFADYVYFDEGVLAHDTGLDAEATYRALLELSRRDILNYVPRSLIPYIYYPTSRDLPKHVIIGRDVYEARRDVMAARIAAMRAFVFDDSRCRVRQMLEYFGETPESDCGTCDVCRARAIASSATSLRDRARDRVLRGCSRSEGATDAELYDGQSPQMRHAIAEVVRALTADGSLLPADSRTARRHLRR